MVVSVASGWNAYRFNRWDIRISMNLEWSQMLGTQY